MPDRNKENGLLLVCGSGDMVHHCAMGGKDMVADGSGGERIWQGWLSQQSGAACEWDRFLL